MGVGVAICGGLAVLVAALAWWPVVRLRRLAPIDPAAIARARRAPEGERPAIVEREAVAGSWLDGLCRELRQARDDRRRVATVNEALGEAEGALESHAHWPRAIGWTAALAGTLALLLAWTVGGFRELGLALPLALAGVLSAAWARRAERRERARQRRLADAAVALLVGELHRVEVELPGRKRRRRS